MKKLLLASIFSLSLVSFKSECIVKPDATLPVMMVLGHYPVAAVVSIAYLYFFDQEQLKNVMEYASGTKTVMDAVSITKETENGPITETMRQISEKK